MQNQIFQYLLQGGDRNQEMQQQQIQNSTNLLSHLMSYENAALNREADMAKMLFLEKNKENTSMAKSREERMKMAKFASGYLDPLSADLTKLEDVSNHYHHLLSKDTQSGMKKLVAILNQRKNSFGSFAEELFNINDDKKIGKNELKPIINALLKDQNAGDQKLTPKETNAMAEFLFGLKADASESATANNAPLNLQTFTQSLASKIALFETGNQAYINNVYDNYRKKYNKFNEAFSTAKNNVEFALDEQADFFINPLKQRFEKVDLKDRPAIVSFTNAKDVLKDLNKMYPNNEDYLKKQTDILADLDQTNPAAIEEHLQKIQQELSQGQQISKNDSKDDSEDDLQKIAKNLIKNDFNVDGNNHPANQPNNEKTNLNLNDYLDQTEKETQEKRKENNTFAGIANKIRKAGTSDTAAGVYIAATVLGGAYLAKKGYQGYQNRKAASEQAFKEMSKVAKEKFGYELSRKQFDVMEKKVAEKMVKTGATTKAVLRGGWWLAKELLKVASSPVVGTALIVKDIYDIGKEVIKAATKVEPSDIDSRMFMENELSEMMDKQFDSAITKQAESELKGNTQFDILPKDQKSQIINSRKIEIENSIKQDINQFLSQKPINPQNKSLQLDEIFQNDINLYKNLGNQVESAAISEFESIVNSPNSIGRLQEYATKYQKYLDQQKGRFTQEDVRIKRILDNIYEYLSQENNNYYEVSDPRWSYFQSKILKRK